MSANFEKQNADLLIDDVLLKVFVFLEDSDLERCEAVCHKWRRLVNHCWKRLFHQKLKTSVLWQKCWTTMKRAETVRHQEIGNLYKTISREIQRLDANWRKGRYTQTTYLLEANIMNHSFRMADNYLITMPSKSGFNIIDRRTMKVRHKVSPPGLELTCLRSHDNLIICSSDRFIKVFSVDTGEQIHEFEEPNGWTVLNLDFWFDGLVAAISGDRHGSFLLTLWRMYSPTDVKYLKHLSFTGEEWSRVRLRRDGENILVLLRNDVENLVEMRRVSTKTLTIEKLLTTGCFYIWCGQGVAIFLGNKHISIVLLPENKMIILKCTSASGLYNPMVNSSFVAMARPKYREESSEMDRIGTEVTILDLEVLRRTEKNEDLHDSHFRSKFDVPFNISSFVMDETEIVCYQHTPTSESSCKVMVLNFSPKHSVLFDKSRTVCT